MQSPACRVGVFDSGVGGLTVVRALQRQLGSAVEAVYVGDTARVPYGTKSAAVVTRYALEAATYLISQDIDALVVACNTASAHALTALQETFPSLPIVGVVEPGAREAATRTRVGRVGVLATEGTIRSQAYTRAILAARPDIEVVAAAAPLFVPLAEEGWQGSDVARRVAETYTAPLREAGVDVIVLGCTHYPILAADIAAELPDGIAIVDSAEPTIAELAARLGLQRRDGELSVQFITTDVPDRFIRVGARFLGAPITAVQQVDLATVLA